jgi:uncharacterized protein (DUF736 family)
MILVGTLEIKYSDKSGKILFAIPFRGNFDYFLSENKEKKKDTSPDFIIWNKSMRIGFIWKSKYSKDGEEKNYLSGNIFAPGLGIADNKMKLVIFESQNKNPGIWAGFVYWNDESKESEKPIDQNLEVELNNDETIF